MATYRTKPHDSLGARIFDVAVGSSIGAILAVLLWLATIWMVAG